jgi:putative alpha-1,2-mannosidase
MKYGYVPADLEKESASKTLEYAYDDWTIARMAAALGRADDQRLFEKRGRQLPRHLRSPGAASCGRRRATASSASPSIRCTPSTAATTPRGTPGSTPGSSPTTWPGLIQAMGGRERFVARLDELFALKAAPDAFKQVEDIAGLIGQYAHGNEPSHHIAYLYSYAGQPWRTQERVHQITRHAV